MSTTDTESNDHGSNTSDVSELRSDVLAGVINAVVSVPDGLASAALVGVNPVYGLYTSIAAPIGGSLLVSAQLMQISTTSASALAAAQAIASYPGDQRAPALFLLVILTGVLLGLFGLLRFGRLVRFVSRSVMTGFLIGVAVVLVLDQLAPFVGFSPEGGNTLTQFFDLAVHVGQFDAPTIVTGALALGLAFGLARTPLSPVAALIALVVPTLLVGLMDWGSVQRVSDVSPIPRGLPALTLPDLTLFTPQLMLAALAVASVIAVQGAGVSQSVENPDGSEIVPSRDMVAQGVANAASGLLSGIPAGGSVGQTALNVSVGARSRWAGVFGGLWMVVIVLLIPGLIGQVPMAVLAALMIQAGISAIDIREARSIWSVGGTARWLILVTFLATLVVSVPVAVAVGVALSIVFYLQSSASDVRIQALVPTDDGGFEEISPPERLPSNAVTILDVYGSLFFAGARTLGEKLPSPGAAERPAVVLRMRGYTKVGATLVDVLGDYARDLAAVGGRLYLSGVDEDLDALLKRARDIGLGENVHIVPAAPTLGVSTEKALSEANTWLGGGDTSPTTEQAWSEHREHDPTGTRERTWTKDRKDT